MLGDFFGVAAPPTPAWMAQADDDTDDLVSADIDDAETAKSGEAVLSADRVE